MKIGILDTDHYFYIYTLIQIFTDDKNEITVYTNPKIYKRCKEDLAHRTDIKYVVQASGESWEEFLEKNHTSINTAGFSYFFILPIYNYYKEHYRFISKLKTLNILVVFNLNGWVNPSLLKNIFWFWPTFYKRRIMKLVKWIAIDEHYHQYALKLGSTKNIVHIPSALYDADYVAQRPPVKAPIKIIVPGTIHKERRDYDVVLEALQSVLEKSQDFSVVFLGDPIADYGKEILKRADELNKKYGKEIIKTYPKEYNDAEFLRQILLGHFLIAPVLPEFKLDGIIEVYGTSKSTGSCFDILAYAIPGVFPGWLSVNSKFDSSILRYNNAADLSKLILNFVEHPKLLEDLRTKAITNSEHFSVDKIRTRLINSLPTPLT